MHKLVVINAVGLTPGLIGSRTPKLQTFMQAGASRRIGPVLPAVTTTVQSTYLTGAWPNEHGIVANGWYFRDECEIKFWRQSNKLVQRPKIWEKAKQLDPAFTCANHFWWYNMYSSSDYAVTPRPMYPADGRKFPDIWTWPLDLRRQMQKELGQFPLFQFWGPATSIKATQWIANGAKWLDERKHPTLTLIYLPHLDYVLQRDGPDSPKLAKDLRELDDVCGDLIDYYNDQGARIIILSEYGITPVSKPVHLNRILREAGLLSVREELGHELLDAGASRAFAVADHQVAHVYVNDASQLSKVRSLIQRIEGVAEVLDDDGKRRWNLDHPRSGELVVLSKRDAWFTYYYWLDEARAPDFAHTVDIHRKPGYDPVELFIDPGIALPKMKIALTLLRRKLGQRPLMNVIPTDAALIKGSHGLPADRDEDAPMVISSRPDLLGDGPIPPTDIFSLILRHLM